MSKSIASIAIKKQDTMAEISYMRTIRTPDEYERPIFKWVGGKFSELPTVLEHLPHGKRLIEPFVGGGSVFTNAGFRHNLLNDINGDLINFYQTLQREGHSLVTLSYSFSKITTTLTLTSKCVRHLTEESMTSYIMLPPFCTLIGTVLMA